MSGDGCSSMCMIENGYYCVQLPTNLLSYCTKTWGNGHIDSGEDFDDGNSMLGDGWDVNCKYEIGFKCHNYADKPSFWYPNWGDGIRDTTSYNEEWDDGNNIDFDGWSGKCKVEANYVWNHGVHGDVCETKYSAPVIKSSTFDSKPLQVTIEFDQIMLQQNLTSFEMSVDISGPNSPYSVSWTATFDKSNLRISFSSAPVLLGGINEIVLVQLIEVSKFKSEHSISIFSTNLFTFKVSGLPPSESTQSGGSGGSYMLIFAMLLSIGVSIFTGGSIELMWSLANTLQILFYFGILNLYYTPELGDMFSYMKYSNFDNPAFEYIKSKFQYLTNFVKISIPSSFASLRFPSVSIVINFFDKLMM